MTSIKRSRTEVAHLVLLGLGLSVAGCEFLVWPDRDAIPGPIGVGGGMATGSGGAGGAGGDAATGTAAETVASSSDASTVAASSSVATTSAASSSTGGSTDKELGVVCKTGSECASGFCVDGVCCDSACKGACAACSKAAGAKQAGFCEESAVRDGQDAKACDDDFGSCGGDCTCDAMGACVLQTTVAQVVSGAIHSCARFEDGTVKCWGWNVYGQLGLGDKLQRGDGPGEMGDGLPRIALGTGLKASALAAGGNRTCAILEGGTVKCWGANGSGQLGLGSKEHRGDGPGEMGDDLPPVDLGTGSKALALALGTDHTCALLEGGTVKCWGKNDGGQLGLGDTAARGDEAGEMGDALPPVALGTGEKAVALAAGADHTCALLESGGVKCWGRNTEGQLGLGDTSDRGSSPGEMGDDLPTVELGAGLKATSLDAGVAFTCAILDDASLKCWGKGGSGQLGNAGTDALGDDPEEMGSALAPVDLGTGKVPVEVSCGDAHVCARIAGGSVKCWGANAFGQLGLGDTSNRGDGSGEMGDSLPSVSLGANVSASALAVGGTSTCARLEGASVKCWGKNFNGQLGLGDTANRGDGQNELGDNLPNVRLLGK